MSLRRDVTIQPLSGNTLQPTRPTGILNLREKVIQIFQEESERACEEDAKYRKFLLKGRLTLTVNGEDRIFIEINDTYPHDNGATSPEIPLESTGIPPIGQNQPMNTPGSQIIQSALNYDFSPTTYIDQAMIDRVTSLGQLELLRRYTASQIAQKQPIDHNDNNHGDMVKDGNEPVNLHPMSGSPAFPKNAENDSERRSESRLEPQTPINLQITANPPVFPSRTTSTDVTHTHSSPVEESTNLLPKQVPAHHPENNSETIPVSTSLNDKTVDESSTEEARKCYLCEEVFEDRMAFLLHVEKHYQNLAQKFQQEQSADTLLHQLEEYGMSLEKSKNRTKPKKPSPKSQKKTKTPKAKTKAAPKESPTAAVVYKEDSEEDENFLDGFTDDEANDPNFVEDSIQVSKSKQTRGPSTRSRSKSNSDHQLPSKRKTPVSRKSKKSTPEAPSTLESNITEINADVNTEDEQSSLTEKTPESSPPKPKKSRRSANITAPFIPRQIKTKQMAKLNRLTTTPKMALKIRMKEKTKALAIKAANEAIAVTVTPDLKCTECDKQFTNRKAYIRHARRHSTKKCQCDICGKSFSTLDSLCHHQRGLHGNTKPYSCEECGQTFNFHHSYKLHKQKHSGERPYKCEHCNKSYLTSSHLKAHCTAVHNQGKKSKFVCTVCGKTFNYQNSLRTHQMIHSGERPHTCSLCQKGFVSRQALRTHEQSYHVTAKNFKCDICNKFYKSEMLLNVHKRRHTSDVSRFMCDICGRQFMFKSNLEAHKYVHQDGRPFGCDTCGKSFKCMSSLYTHQYTHKLETPFLCKLCGKAFKTKNCCKAHERRHTAEKSFICPTCGSCFPDKGGLSKHIRTIHNPHKHFVCKLCNKIGTRADNMRTHVKSHGKDIGSENIENFIIEVFNPDGVPLTESVIKMPTDAKPRYSTNPVSQEQHPQTQTNQDPQQQMSTLNYSQLDLFQSPSTTMQSHLPQSTLLVNSQIPSTEHNPHMIQHFTQQHNLVNIISHNNTMTTQPLPLPQGHISHVSNTQVHAMTPPLSQSNNSMTPPLSHSSRMTPPITHSVTPTPPMAQSMSPSQAMVQMNPSYTTLHPLTTETMVMGGMGGAYQPLYAPYKHQ
ncbi:hypothetical protein SNE40_017645 [Patella caerulea]